MDSLKVNLRKKIDDSYEIIIGRGVSKKLPGIMAKKFGKRKAVIITDKNVEKIYGKKLLSVMNRSGMDCCIASFESGEKNKRLSTVEMIQEKMLANGINRRSVAVVLRGGVAGDVGGFAAATYMRGIDFVQLPTTLLAMVDSSVGGKTGVDLPSGKNMSGTFTQPKMVLIDTDFLRSLPEKEFSNGMAEVIKYGVIADSGFFSFIERNKIKINKRNPRILQEIIRKSCEVKAKVIVEDEKESNLRKILNYGHTVGHAIEAAGSYARYSHGEAIARGMHAEAIISNKLGGLRAAGIGRQKELFGYFGLPAKLPKLNIEKLMAIMLKDKKSEKKNFVFALPGKIGKMMKKGNKFGIVIKADIVKNALRGAGK